jgi:hypothetical protein
MRELNGIRTVILEGWSQEVVFSNGTTCQFDQNFQYINVMDALRAIGVSAPSITLNKLKQLVNFKLASMKFHDQRRGAGIYVVTKEEWQQIIQNLPLVRKKKVNNRIVMETIVSFMTKKIIH